MKYGLVSAEFNKMSMVHSSTVSYAGCVSHIDSIVSMCPFVLLKML